VAITRTGQDQMLCRTDPACGFEIAGRVRAIRESGGSVLPPVLLLGMMERVGSNWVSDTLRSVTGQHNEPFRQQVGPAHPLLSLNPGMSPDDTALRLGPYGQHWLVTFAAGKYAPVRQVIKETNLFFALPAFLALFPGSPAAVLTRSPLGVASSFARGDLFRRWDYRARYRQMTAMTTRPELATWAGIVPDDQPSDLAVLARLQVLNSPLLATALHSRGVGGLAVIRYETAVLDPAAARAELARLVPEAPGFSSPEPAAPAAAEDTFATTTGRAELIAGLTAADASEIGAAVDRALSAGRHRLTTQHTEPAATSPACRTGCSSEPGGAARRDEPAPGDHFFVAGRQVQLRDDQQGVARARTAPSVSGRAVPSAIRSRCTWRRCGSARSPPRSPPCSARTAWRNC
jgi:hypothetical protein